MRVLYVVLQAIIGLAIIAVAWIVASVVVQDANKLPALGTVVNRALELATSDSYREHVNASTSVLLLGLLPAIAAGILFGFIAGVSPVFRWLFGPLFVTLAAVPLIALMPLLLLWFGLGPILTASAVAIITFFPVANVVMTSLASRQGTVALAIVRGLRWGIVFGASSLVICEMLAARTGAGTFIMTASAQFNIVGVAAGIMLVFVRDRDRGDPARDRRAARGVSRVTLGTSSGLNVRRIKQPYMIGDPACQHVLANLAGRQSEHHCGRRLLRRIEIHSIEAEEDDHRRKRCSFVAVNERMIARDAEAVGRGQHRKIGLAVRELVPRSGEGRLKKTKIADAVGPAEERQLFGMKIEDDVELEPFNRLGHFASAL